MSYFSSKQREKINLDEVVTYLTTNVFPSKCTDRGKKTNFKRQCKPYTFVDGKLMYAKCIKNETTLLKELKNVQIIRDRNEQNEIIKVVHEGHDSSLEAKALSSHHGRIATTRLISSRFYWANFTHDIAKYISECHVCQVVNSGSAKIKTRPELHPVGVDKHPMTQIGVDLTSLPEVNGYRYVVVAIDYFSKWTEAEALKDKCAASVANFLYRLICRHGCFKIQINDQGREFVNQVSDELHSLTGVKQRLTSAYHPQANGLVERQNRTIKNSLLKVLESETDQWPSVLQGVLFAHRSVKHSSTGYSPFFMLYHREALLPIDIMVNHDDEDADEPEEVGVDHSMNDTEEPAYDEKEYHEILSKILLVKKAAEGRAMHNIEQAQEKQKQAYDKRHRIDNNVFLEGNRVLLRNMKRNDRKGGWAQAPWVGPYEILKIFKNSCTLKNVKTNKILKSSYSIYNVKLYQEKNPDFDYEEEEGEETIDARNNCTENTVDKDVEFLGESKVQTLFMPVTSAWQKATCNYLGLTLVKSHIMLSTKYLKSPKKVVKIIGGGNCWFRAVSHWITGSEKFYAVLRDKVVTLMASLSEEVDDYTEKADYIGQSKMSTNGVWATDVEILATASLLSTDIYVYGHYGAALKWQKFSRHGFTARSNQELEEENRMSLYISNSGGSHFEVVTDVER